MAESLVIVEAFEAVEQALNQLCLHVHDELREFPLWIDNGAGALTANRDKVIYALKHFQPTLGLAPQETYACVGAVGGTRETLHLVERVNHAKTQFKQHVDQYLKETGGRDTALIREILAHHGYPAIKLKQVYRQIRTIPYHPRRIAFSQGRHNSHKIITKRQAEQLLQEIGQGLHIEIQLAKLSLLGSQEKLAIHRDVQACWLANVATFKNEEGHSITEKVQTSLPLFYCHDLQLPEPHVLFSQRSTRHKALPRADKRIEDEPFLSSLSAYRYK